MKKISNYISCTLILFFSVATFTSCNKDLPLPTPIIPPEGSVSESIGDIINSDPNYSFFKAAALRVGVLNSLSDNNNVFTLFLPDNDAFVLSGITSEDMLNAFPVETVAAIVSYHLIPGQRLTSADVPTTFPNIQEPSALTIGTIPGTILPIKLFNFPSRRATGFWLNNIPVTAFDIPYKNGIVHKVAAIVNPPSKLLAQIIYADPRFTILAAAIARGDSGQAGLNRIDSAIRFPLANLTVFAPTNDAFKPVLSALTGGLIPAAAPDAVFIGFISTSVPVQTARGIVVYHILPSRAFSVNFPAEPTFIPTLLNGGIPAHPGVQVQATFIGPFATALTVLGVGNGGVPANVTTLDLNAVNGIVHVIDKVLLPQ